MAPADKDSGMMVPNGPRTPHGRNSMHGHRPQAVLLGHLPRRKVRDGVWTNGNRSFIGHPLQMKLYGHLPRLREKDQPHPKSSFGVIFIRHTSIPPTGALAIQTELVDHRNKNGVIIINHMVTLPRPVAKVMDNHLRAIPP